MIASLEWETQTHEGGRWLHLVAGGLRLDVAEIEDYQGDGWTMLYLHRWACHESGETFTGELRTEIPCRSVAEARAVCAALLGVRGLVVPEWVTP